MQKSLPFCEDSMNLHCSRIPVVATVLILFLVATALAFGPTTVSYQGRLTNSVGQPLNGTFQIKFAIYADAGGPFPAGWQETQSVTCVDGFFTVQLGATTPINMIALSYPQQYLGITVGTDPELVPRNKLAASMFSLRVTSVDGALGGQVYGELKAENSGTNQRAFSALGGITGGSFWANQASSNSVGVEGRIGTSQPVNAIGVLGESQPTDGFGIGGSFYGGRTGLMANVIAPDNSTKDHTAAFAFAEGYGGTGTNAGMLGLAGGAYMNMGVYGFGFHAGTPGAYAYGVFGEAQFVDGYGAWAGYFNGWTTCNGTLEVAGTLLKPGGAFRIDHPLDPENKFLQHSFVESPDMKNIYDGNVVTDANGDAVVSMPDWFDALNRDFRYQLTVIGQFAQAIVSEEIRDGRFAIKTDKPNVKVSWQVTGIRQDAYANAHRIQVEVDKDSHQRGRYIDPVAFGKPQELQLHYEMNKAAADMRIASEQRDAKNRESK